MKKIHLFNVVPVVPPQLSALEVLARNLYWTWNPEAYNLFSRINRELWLKSGQNPVMLLSKLPQSVLEDLAVDAGFLTHLSEVHGDFLRYMARHKNDDSGSTEDADFVDQTANSEPFRKANDILVAYFSAEFGLAKCLPIYSGGLGVLSGDHLKAASDLNLPLVGVGLLYRKGYFQQYINNDGWQQERYDIVDPYNTPMSLVRNKNGSPVKIAIDLPQRKLHAQIWRMDVGRIALFLLDTRVQENNQEDQKIGSYLYGGGKEMRIKQELLLGIGGVKALKAMNINPKVYHMNEGHSAFMALERIRNTMSENNLGFPVAQAACSRGNVFTTHTPVPAGFDLFNQDLIQKYLGKYIEELGVSFESFLRSGRGNPYSDEEPFNMAVYAARNSNFVNGVSKLHGEVSRRIFHSITPDVPVHEIPIESITNGVHHTTWTHAEMWHLLNRYLGPKWIENPDDKEIWRGIFNVPDAELWRVKDRLRAQLVAYTRRRVEAALESRGASPKEIESANEVMDPEILTIGFARRFATYKRAALIFSDLDRLKKILCHPTRPVQILFAGKAHPKDDLGKKIIQQIIHASQDPELRRHIAFLENYDLGVARHLISGVDLWLNNPRRPLEASGTSGMKVVFNGGLNLSVLDGWWCEGFRPDCGWAIGSGETYSEEEKDYGDSVESEATYHILEQEIVPLFYERDTADIPRAWIRRVKNSMAELCPQFNNHRMVREYNQLYYEKSTEDFARLSADGFAKSREEADWLERVYKNMENVHIKRAEIIGESVDITVGGALRVEAEVDLAHLSPEEIRVEAYTGGLDEEGEIEDGRGFLLDLHEEKTDGGYVFRGAIPCRDSGQHAFRVRVRPYREGIRTLFAPVRWEN